MILRKIYNWYISTFVFHYFHFLMRKYLKKYSEKIVGDVLDIGCGEKPYIDLFTKIKKYRGTNSESYYKNSLITIGENDTLVEDGTNLPFENEFFDAVLNFQVLPVFEDPVKFYIEVKRILKPGGTFLLTTDFLYPIWNAPKNFWRTTKYALEKLAKENGFEPIEIEAFGGYWIMHARVFERYFRGLLPKLIKSIKNEKKFLIKIMKILRIIIWLIFVLLSPILINFVFVVFHLLDQFLLDEEFTTNYLVFMRKEK